jgi:hypothetical protein
MLLPEHVAPKRLFLRKSAGQCSWAHDPGLQPFPENRLSARYRLATLEVHDETLRWQETLGAANWTFP